MTDRESEARALAEELAARLKAASAHSSARDFDLRELEDPTLPAAVVFSVADTLLGRVFSTRRDAILALEDWWVARLRREAHENAAARSLGIGDEPQRNDDQS